MSKKNKKKQKPALFSWEFDSFEAPTPKEGELRFHQKIVEVYKEPTVWNWGRWETIKETPKVLQVFQSGEWQDIPLEKEWISV